MILLFKLILAHLVGDFILQPDGWVKSKESRKLKSPLLYVHALVHGLLSWLLVWEWAFAVWALLITGIHLLIDIVKLLLQKEENRRYFFFADQILHLVTLFLIYTGYTHVAITPAIVCNEKTVLLVTALVFLTAPVSILMREIISKWTPQTGDNKTHSLEDAGKYIGMLERLFVFLFVVKNLWAAIGFLMAAKSIFRFGDLTKAKDRKLTEYILIGTLLSFGISILTGLLYLRLL